MARSFLICKNKEMTGKIRTEMKFVCFNRKPQYDKVMDVLVVVIRSLFMISESTFQFGI